MALPPRGSPRDRVLQELLRREIDAECSKLSLQLSIEAAGAGADLKKVSPLITDLLDRISHRAYSSEHIRGKLQEKLSEMQQLQRVSDLS